MSTDYFAIREQIRNLYGTRSAPSHEIARAKAEPIGNGGFLTEIAGRVILTAPAKQLSVADELPRELATRWAEQAATGNEHYLWLQGRYVEAEQANRNGAFWTTADLQFGEMSVKNGPINWIHDERLILGSITDNALIHPSQAEAAGVLDTPMPRPYMAAVGAVWKWINPERAQIIERANDIGKLYWSMECIGNEMACVTDGDRQGCGKSFDYVTAVTSPKDVCEHIAGRTSARRMVDPVFLGGAVIVPPANPGWGGASLEVMRQSASLAEQAHTTTELSDTEWEALMGHVVSYATALR